MLGAIKAVETDSEQEEPLYPPYGVAGDVLFYVGGPPDVDFPSVFVADAEGCIQWEIETVGLDFILDAHGIKLGMGWFVIEKANAHYFRGDGWTTDDDVEFDIERIRPALLSEVEAAGYRFGNPDNF